MSALMPHDTYHGDTTGPALGLRITQMQRTARIGVTCIACNLFRVYGWETFQHFRRDMPVAWLHEMLAPSCYGSNRSDCRRVVVSPDDGCSDAG